MWLRYTQIETLALYILKHLEKKNLFSAAKPASELASLITDVFKKNVEEEEKLHEEAKRLLEQNKRKLGLNIDEEKALSMIKKQLAKERDFVL